MKAVLSWVAVAVVVLAAMMVVAWWVSPWPRVVVIRWFFDRGGAVTARSLARYVPPGVAAIRDLAYRSGDPAARLDVFFPASVSGTPQRLPTVVWVHGGGWVAGHRSDIANYTKILTAQGFTTVAVGYALPPEALYPTPVEEVNAALGFLAAHAARLHVDGSRFVLAGDSAGAQIAAQLAAIVTEPAYARAMGIHPDIGAGQLAATVLACGAYDFAGGHGWGGLVGRFFSAVFWAYSGRRDFADDPSFRLMSVARHLTPAFPPTFLTAGNGDPLVGQSREMARRLRALGVSVDTLFYPPAHRPRLPHEYQFNLGTPAGRDALHRIVAFLRARTGSP